MTETASDSSATTDAIRQIYAEAAGFFSRLAPAPHYGFKLLNRPPRFRPPVLFVGYQPGGAAPEDYSDCWPSESQYATANWVLARKMRQLFADNLDLLEHGRGVNAIFVRAPSVDAYRGVYGRQARAEIAGFCLARVVRIVEAIEPKSIVAIGHATLRLFGRTEAGCRGHAGRVLIRTGSVAGRPAIAMLHLTGAHISEQDLRAIRTAVLSFIKQTPSTASAHRQPEAVAMPHPLSSNELEAANRAEATALEHRNIQHTVRYTELSPTRFKDFWRA